MKSLKSIFLIDKLADDSQNLITFYKYYNFTNPFVPKIIQFEKLTREDKDVIADLANSAHDEEIYGLELYAKLMELEKTGKIQGDSICKSLFIAFLE